ncbi:MAG TPA: fatty acid oxidation complex subunit alpha FadB [Marinospirillum sp.]|uniref:fatty acid oxidation complex subunit alpha FadB n=1 Tax=Marinospirillum sp. TaxID=2183934 RepID=UPI002B47344B|nr:fatty acid oxidation complex subunit alpha FadB [Marinospirillum sp.]HKM15730.1 fatty acid oxidation complex subunit alpha FadB [Marinospirillum sp.]
MIYQGKAIQVHALTDKNSDGIVELIFDRQGEAVNVLSTPTIKELGEAVAAIKAKTGVKGLLMSSAKEAFIVGADITEFHGIFGETEEFLVEMNLKVHELFNSIEDLPFPTVTAINGLALGGGCEMLLTTDFRVMADTAKIGLPETKLGIVPGWGGCVRLPRLIGADNAIEWIAGGTENRADVALKMGAADAVVSKENLRDAALDILAEAQAGNLDWQARREQKKAPLKLNPIESMMVFETAKGFVAGKAGPHYPAPVEAIKAIQKGATASREKAQLVEAKTFAKMAKTDVCYNLVGLFLNDQLVKKKAAAYQKQVDPVKKAAVLGAGIMGGGVAYQSASKGTPIMMKDINEAALQLGLKEASKLLGGQLKRKRITAEQMAEALGRIRPTLSYGDFGDVELTVEAVVENAKVKATVLAELENHVAEDAIIASNTSTISINSLAKNLKRPENFCGMHFFNPVHRMPLVEVIRGEKSSEKAIAATVTYAKQMGKTPIVVNDCPGFLVNRILFPYFGGFIGLVEQGADFRRVDKVMENFGWPMGPAYLLDVVGLDTAVHANDVMAEGFPDRMKREGKTVLNAMYDAGRLGQKNSTGFYKYEEDRKGKPQKKNDETTDALIQPLVKANEELTDEQIIARMMVPLCLETVRCLEDNIVGTPAEADMALIYGIGFPPFRGGALRYIDAMGVQAFVDLADSLAELGPLYAPTDKLRAMAANNEQFYN